MGATHCHRNLDLREVLLRLGLLRRSSLALTFVNDDPLAHPWL
jgi:hypothetical protein